MHPDQKTLDALNEPKPFQAYPKMLYHPDGRNIEVPNEEAEAALPSEWQQTPQDAIDLKAAREQIDRDRNAAAIASAVKDAADAEAEGNGKGKSKAK